jgi:hexulose-6-phosphate isomerase
MQSALSRRRFLVTSALATAALASRGTGRPEEGAGDQEGGESRDGESGTILERFQMIKDAGFEGIELNRPDAVPIQEILDAKKATGLEIAGVICTTHWGKPLNSGDAHGGGGGDEGTATGAGRVRGAGCRNLLLVPGVVNKGMGYEDCWKRSIAQIKECIPDAEKAKCRIAIENVWNQFIIDPLSAARYVDEFNSPWVGWHLDLGNLITFGWPEHWIRTLGKRVFNLHIKEFSRKKRDNEGLWKGFSVELGEGDNDWAATMARWMRSATPATASPKCRVEMPRG